MFFMKVPKIELPEKTFRISSNDVERIDRLLEEIESRIYEIVLIRSRALEKEPLNGPYNLTYATFGKDDNIKVNNPEPLFLRRPLIVCTPFGCICGFRDQVWNCTPPNWPNPITI
jgi:hypothetical protein